MLNNLTCELERRAGHNYSNITFLQLLLREYYQSTKVVHAHNTKEMHAQKCCCKVGVRSQSTDCYSQEKQAGPSPGRQEKLQNPGRILLIPGELASLDFPQRIH